MIFSFKRFNLGIAVFFLCSFLGVAQTPKDDLIAFGKKMNALSAYEVNVEVKVFKNAFDLKPGFASKGKTAKQGNKFYLDMLNRSTLVNEGLMLVVDNSQKLMMYSEISEEQLKQMINAQTINVDSIVKAGKMPMKYLIDDEKEKRIEITPPKGEMKSILISFDTKTSALKEIVYLYSDDVKKNTGNAKVVISYVNFEFSVKNPEIFNTGKYIMQKGKNIAQTAAYKNYKLINSKDFQNK